MIEGPRAIFLYVTNLDIGREWYSRALEVEPASIDEESVTFTVGGCLLTLKLTTAASHSLTSVYWGVDDLEWEYRRISEIGKMPTQSAQLAYVDSNAVELLDPFGNVFGLLIFSKNMTTNLHLTRYVFRNIAGEYWHGAKQVERSCKEASARRADAAKGQGLRRGCAGSGRGTPNRVHMEGAAR